MYALKNYYPQKIICLTEESVETLYELGKEHLISGVSVFVKRPEQATKLPKVSYFNKANIEKIVGMKADLILGFSDIQKDIAKDLIEAGQNVFIANHRGLQGILDYVGMLSHMVDAKSEGEVLLSRMMDKIEMASDFARTLKVKPKVYFEEWDKPMISAIGWVSDIIELCGGIDVNRELSSGILAKERFVDPQKLANSDPDIIFGCWCGKRVKIEQILTRVGWENISAIAQNQVFELEPEIFLQPGPACILAGIDIMIEYFRDWSNGQRS